MDMSDKKFWGDKPYFSLDHYLKQTFGEKVYRLSLNGGMTCPNRDGTLDSRGCIFCSAGGSGDFATAPSLSVTEQITQAKERIRRKSNCRKFIAYFQAYTNTYAPVSYLRELFTEAIEQPDIASLSIATRCDCLPPEVLDLLSELNCQKPVWIELGLQSIHNDTLRQIRSGFTYEQYLSAVDALKDCGLSVITHLILGLPGETEETIKRTSDFILSLELDDMNMAKFTPFPGAPLWSTIREEGAFEEDWRLMNCLNFVFVPHGIKSSERLDYLYNEYVKRFYSDAVWRKKFRSRLWQHRKSLMYLLRHLPSFWSAKNQFEPGKNRTP